MRPWYRIIMGGIYEGDGLEVVMKTAAHCHLEVGVDRSQWDPLGLDFLHLGQRHFEKELPFPVSYTPGPSGCSLYRLPVDFVRMVMPAVGGVTDSIEEILVAYGNKSSDQAGVL